MKMPTVVRTGEDKEATYSMEMDHQTYCRIQMMLTYVHNTGPRLSEEEKVWLRDVGKVMDEGRRPAWLKGE